jgi:hypothetical protein
VVAAVVDREPLAFEDAKRFFEDRRAALAARPWRLAETVLDPRREGHRLRPLSGLEHVDREAPRLGQSTGACGLLVDADQEQRWIERYRGEAVDRQTGRFPALVEAGDDRHPGGEAAERVAQRPRIVPASIFVPGRLVGHVAAYSASMSSGVNASTSATVRSSDSETR